MSEVKSNRAWRLECEALRAELAACAAALPGVYYMDSPDGGDVPVSEQLRLMAKDAERYRLLRRKFAIISDLEGHAKFCAINLPRPTYIAPSSAIELDTALDRERLGCRLCGHSIDAHDKQYGCAEDGCECETPNSDCTDPAAHPAARSE
jgi:hypothetical protein